ncbi:MAG: hypothetical protein JST26_04595 [Bacteroidetes bacterium]|nr:hypothetical protein [Bacteroidota bacterium]
MATDGVKIIDGDTAHDVYWGIMDLYDSGADLETIFKKYPLSITESGDDFDDEIYITACGLAYWEIGQMTADKLTYIKSIIDKGACVSEWAEEDEKSGKARQKVLDKYFEKISNPNLKVRPRKKYRKITNLYFQPDDLLTFRLKDGSYCAVICALVSQHRGQCNYILVPTTYKSDKKPVVEDILNKEILGGTIFSSFSQEQAKAFQPDIERIWKFIGRTNVAFGVVQIAVTHQNFTELKDKFEKIGTLKIAESLKRPQSLGYESSFEGFENIFSDLDNHIRIFKQEKYPVKVLCDI